MTKRKIDYWVIPPEADGEFVAPMEEVLETYAQPYDARYPVVCMGGPDAAAGDAAVAGGQFILDVGGRQQPDRGGPVVRADAGGQAALAGSQNLVYKVVHSKL